MRKKETWCDIKGYEGFYQVSNIGKVRSLTRTIMRSNGHSMVLKGRVMKSFIGVRGYFVVTLQKEGSAKTKYVHILIASLFIPNPDNKPEVNHKNGIRTDNRIINLEWTTRRENGTHAFLINRKTSIYPGVARDRKKKKWRASIQLLGKNKFLGNFNSEIKASEAYQKELLKNGIINKYAIGWQ